MRGEQLTILNVDDQEPGRYAKRRILERAGYAVVDAGSGRDTLRLLDEVHPALVLLDVRMPDMSGLDVCRRIKSLPEHADTMVLHISASKVTGDDRAKGFDVGSDGYLVEPVEQEELLASVRALLRLRERQRENQALLERLRRSEEQFRGLFEQAAVGMCVVGPDGRLLRVNEKLCAITGRTADELLKYELRDLSHPEDRAEHESQVGKLLLGGVSEVSLDQRLLRPDGDTIWVTVTLSIQWDAGGRIQSLIGVVEDVDARKRAELELRNHALWQQLLSETMDKLLRADDPVSVMPGIFASLKSTLGLDTFLDYDAPGGETIELRAWSGVPEPALEPLKRLKLGEALCGTSAQDRRPIIIGRLQDVKDPKASRMQAVGSTAYACFPLIVGDRLLGTLAFASGRRPSFESDEVELLEAVSSYVAMAKERRRLLHESRRRAEQVAESEERLRFATEGAGMGTWDVDVATGRTVWNPQHFRLLGYDPEQTEASMERWWALVLDEDQAAVREAVAAARQGQGLYQGEHRIRRADTQAVRWLAPYGRMHFDEAGEPARFVGVTFDITERKQTEEQRQEWTRELERRVAERTKELVRTHDRLRGLAQELTLTEQRERQRIASELHDYLAQMLVVTRLKMNQATHMMESHPACGVLKDADGLIDQCLTYTRTLVAELMPPTLRQFGLAAGLRWLGETMSQQGLKVDVTVPAVSPPLSEDSTRLLYQCVRELLFNVLKHSGCHQASVTMIREGRGLTILVEDSGQGCDPSSVMEAKTGKFGLFSIRERMEAIDGWMQLESKSGEGTRVTLGVALAGLADDQSAVSTAAAASAAPTCHGSAEGPAERDLAARGLAPIRVLLVDDHAMVRQGLRSVLDGYADLDIIAEAADGEEAVHLATMLKPDVIVMDVNLPRLDGIEATKRIRHAFPETVVVGLSVNQADHVARAMKEAGAAAFLTKESAADQLYETIESVVVKAGHDV